jgi:hypothetical protein
MSAPSVPDHGYVDRFVAFLDIVGFRKIVTDSQSGADKGRLHRMMRSIRSVLEIAYDRKEGAYRFTAFSDSVVISSDNATLLLRSASQLLQTFAEVGYFLRGGVASGLRFHEGPVVYGPALVRANELESTVATVPRIVVDRSMEGYLERSAEQATKIPDRVLVRDSDGFLRFDPFFTFGWTDGSRSRGATLQTGWRPVRTPE